ncbi:MAG: DUF4199 domain-containing protein [Sphingobacteriales bacterium]|nr:MAG: DUF4199 domain-containing protein [Sphingobacteriales bacterium]
MKRKILLFGSIAGVISAAWQIVTIGIFGDQIDLNYGMWLGYASMLLSFSFIFVAIKSYRDEQSNRQLSFGKAFRIGLFISLIASTFYVVTWLVQYYFFIPDFAEKYTAHMLEQLKADGATQTVIDAKAAEMANFNVMYKNPLFNAMITYMEILPVGLVISVIAAAILKRK